MAGGNGIRIGIALGDQALTGVFLRKKLGSPCTTVPLSLDPEGLESGAELTRAFSQLKASLEDEAGTSTDGASVTTALLPPLADARMVSLPPMREAEAMSVLERDVARYFLGANRPRVVGGRLPKGKVRHVRRGEGQPLPVLAAAASLSLVEAVRSAISSVGWRGVAFAPGHGPWLRAATSVRGSEITSVAAVMADTVHLLRLEGGDPVAVRQIARSDSKAVAEAAGPGRVLVLASPECFENLHPALVGAGLTPFRDPRGWAGAEESTAGWVESSGLELVPPSLAQERKERGRRTVAALAGLTAVFILSSLGVSLWGTHRELASIQSDRESIREQVAPLLEARDSLDGLRTRLESLQGVSRSAPIWTRSLVELAALLPHDTYLTGLFASGDTVEIEAAGSEAGEAIQLLREAGLFQEVRLMGLVERELEEGETVVERFRLWARLPDRSGEGEGS